MKFYGRTEQENKLHRIFRKEEMQTVLIYGRRRVGKSELIRHCLQKENALQLNYECRETAEKSNVIFQYGDVKCGEDEKMPEWTGHQYLYR